MKTKTYFSEFRSDIAVAILGKDDYRYGVMKPLFDICGFGFAETSSGCVFIDGEVKLTKAIRKIGDELVEDVPEWGTAGSYIVVCTGVGDTISEAKDKAYKQVDKVKLGNDPQYRTDIGEKCEKALVKLRRFGFCEGWKY